MKSTFGPQKIMFPCPVALVVTGNMEKANIATIAWVSLLTSSPPTLGISVGTKGFTGDEIKRTGEFTVNIAPATIMKEADFCGITSGKSVDKFKATGLTKLSSKIVSAPIIKECTLNIECKLTSSSIFGTTNHFAGKIVEVHIDSDKLKNPDDFTTLIPELMNPLIYIGTARKYHKLGELHGDAYSTGKDLFNH